MKLIDRCSCGKPIHSNELRPGKNGKRWQRTVYMLRGQPFKALTVTHEEPCGSSTIVFSKRDTETLKGWGMK
jgi:hypothetical protein